MMKRTAAQMRLNSMVQGKRKGLLDLRTPSMMLLPQLVAEVAE